LHQVALLRYLKRLSGTRLSFLINRKLPDIIVDDHRETLLGYIWPHFYKLDILEKSGGFGGDDFIVTPYLNNSVSRHGVRISIERKTGKQKDTGTHFNEAVRHANARGISYAIIVYDTVDNLPEKTLIVRENGVLVAVVDIQSGTWQMGLIYV
jgi:hypothetical protein